jgi:hypothetical protein
MWNMECGMRNEITQGSISSWRKKVSRQRLEKQFDANHQFRIPHSAYRIQRGVTDEDYNIWRQWACWFGSRACAKN